MKKFMISGAVLSYLVVGIIIAHAWADNKNTLAKTTSTCDPYKNETCLDNYLGENFLSCLWHYYQLEMGHAAAPVDLNAPSPQRAGWPATPQSTPPMPFTAWPYGATTSIGVSRPNSVDSPFMTSISNTIPGEWLQSKHIQIYGWVNAGANLSTNRVKPGGNAPIAYMYTPNKVQLDQFRDRLATLALTTNRVPP